MNTTTNIATQISYDGQMELVNNGRKLHDQAIGQSLLWLFRAPNSLKELLSGTQSVQGAACFQTSAKS